MKYYILCKIDIETLDETMLARFEHEGRCQGLCKMLNNSVLSKLNDYPNHYFTYITKTEPLDCGNNSNYYEYCVEKLTFATGKRETIFKTYDKVSLDNLFIHYKQCDNSCMGYFKRKISVGDKHASSKN